MWHEITTYKELSDLNKDCFVVVATFRMRNVIGNMSLYMPNDGLFRRRGEKGYKIGARTKVLQIPDPRKED